MWLSQCAFTIVHMFFQKNLNNVKPSNRTHFLQIPEHLKNERSSLRVCILNIVHPGVSSSWTRGSFCQSRDLRILHIFNLRIYGSPERLSIVLSWTTFPENVYLNLIPTRIHRIDLAYHDKSPTRSYSVFSTDNYHQGIL